MSEKKKIPYSVEPVVREYSGPSGRQSAPPKNRFSAGLFLLAILIFNIALAATIIMSFSNGKSNNQVYVTNNLVAENVETSAVASTTKLSVVCIGAGGSNSSNNPYSQTNLPSRNEMFSNTRQNGAGVIIDVDKVHGTAYVLTCYHVVENYSSVVFVLLYDGNTAIYASVVGYSIANDVAVLKISSNSIKTSICTAATIGNSEFLTEGDFALAVGNPQGKGFSATSGIVSRPISTFKSAKGYSMRGIQVDAAINGGNSGGGLFNAKGEFVGLVQSKISNVEIDNISYALPANLVMNVAQKLIRTNGILTYAVAGYTTRTTTNGQFVDGRYYAFKNVYVDTVSGADAMAAGLSSGDQIVSISYAGKTVQVLSEYTYEDIKYALSVGDTITYNILRGNSSVEISVNITNSSSASQR